MITSLLAILLSAVTGLSQTEDSSKSPKKIPALKWSTSGTPQVYGTYLPALRSFVPITAQRLKDARVVWVNENFWKEWGNHLPEPIAFPVGTAQFNQDLLAAFAFATSESAREEFFVDGQYKSFWTDIYGGLGNNGNIGSGRAAAAGMFQIKGIGQTPMVVHNRPDHSSGRVTQAEAAFEVIWDQLLNGFNPLGSRVVAVIHAGTDEDQMLVIRANPIRPAHFMPIEPIVLATLPPKQTELDQHRVQLAQQMLPKDFTTPEGYKAYIERIAKFRASMFASRYYHPYISASNQEIFGGLIDYNHMSMAPDFSKFFTNEAKRMDALGENTATKKILIHDFFDALRGNLSSGRMDPPNFHESEQIFHLAYNQELALQMVRLTGIPSQALDAISDNGLVNRLGTALAALARKGALFQVPRFGLAEHATRYDMAQLFLQLSNPHISEELRVANAEVDLRTFSGFKSLVADYLLLMNEGFKHFEHKVKTKKSWQQLVFYRAQRLNAFHPELLKDKLHESASSAQDFGQEIHRVLDLVQFEDPRLQATEVLLARKRFENGVPGVHEVWLVYDASIGAEGHHKVVVPVEAQEAAHLVRMDLAGVESHPPLAIASANQMRFEQLISENLMSRLRNGTVTLTFPKLGKRMEVVGLGQSESGVSPSTWTSALHNLAPVKWCKHLAIGFQAMLASKK
jgi:hypothetical protein